MALSEDDLKSIKGLIDAAFKDAVWTITVQQPKVHQPKNESVGELEKLQFDYAWKWFAYHADQRIKMFNYMLLAVGIFATAIVGAINNGFVIGAVAACTCATLLLIVFLRLDRRNRYLVKLGEDLLLQLEQGTIFSADTQFPESSHASGTVAILNRQYARDKKHKIGWRWSYYWVWFVFWGGRHRFWLPAVAAVLAAAFAISGHWFFYHSTEFTKAAPVIKVPDSLSVRLLPPPPTSQPGTMPGKSNSSSGARVKNRTRVSP